VIEIANESTQKMVGLVNSIMDVSRLESGRMPIKYVQTHLGDLVAKTLQAQGPLAADKGLRLEGDVPPTLPPAWADVDLIGRVLQNLVGNAIKFTPPGGVVRVTARVGERDSLPVLLVSVSDTGLGIPSEIRGQLFQKFVSGRQEERGSGLGLAFCKLAIEAHGEHISVESTLGQGTTFTFSLATASRRISTS
jgi:signal transduction histidine kinase